MKPREKSANELWELEVMAQDLELPRPAIYILLFLRVVCWWTSLRTKLWGITPHPCMG